MDASPQSGSVEAMYQKLDTFGGATDAATSPLQSVEGELTKYTEAAKPSGFSWKLWPGLRQPNQGRGR
jgi:hypothetical protein